MSVRMADIVPGARLVTGRRVQCAGRDLSGIVSEFAVVTVEQDEQGLYFVNAAGTRRRFERNTDAYATTPLRIPHEVLWSMPLPEATDEELRRLVVGATGVYGGGSRDKPLLLHVQSVTDTIAFALPVLPTGDERSVGSIYIHEARRPDYVVGNAAISSHMVRIDRGDDQWTLRPGALIVMWPGKAMIVDGLPLHSVKHMIDVMRCSIERLGVWLPKSLSPVGYHSGPFHDVLEIEEEEERAHLRTQPNQALVFGYLDGDGRGGLSLGTSGITFHHSDDLMTDIFGMDDPELGLWVADDAKWTGSGEDVEIESDMRPATAEDIARFGWDEDGIRREIAGNFDVCVDLVPVDICEQAMRQAQEVADVQAWEHSIALGWTNAMMGLDADRKPDSFAMRYPITDFITAARSRLLASDGMEIIAEDDLRGLRWPGAQISASREGVLMVVTPEDTRTFLRNSRISREAMFAPLMEWLAQRPEHAKRRTPDAPRTIVPVRSQD